MIFLYKLLNKLNLLQYFNTTSRVSINNLKVNIPIIKGLGLHNLNHKSSWLDYIISSFKQTNQSIVILDVGVNIGQTLLSIKSLNPDCKYVGFEPNPNCVYYVNKLIKANKFYNTTILPIAISDKIEVLDLYFNNETDSTATIREHFRPNHYDHGFKEQIIAFDLDTLAIDLLKMDCITILKIDIEGAELFALLGAKKIIETYKPVIICEVLDTHSSKTLDNHKNHLKSLESLLMEMDYSIYQIYRNADDTEVVEYKLIDVFEVKIWNTESIKLNDYLFISNKKRESLRTILNLID
ncbi:FkbM family methyltransferase [Xanthomarina sp. GH4-25]|uniref:FkbM family methyltransferase n=1 Tax=Xanthomarina sp. GH4-25 TaxID=3349335 RepID=UPI003878325E